MFARLLRRPRASCFLFGPRGTGKSTWIGQHFAGARIYDLLDTSEALRLAREPATLYREVEGLVITYLTKWSGLGIFYPWKTPSTRRR